MEWHREHLSMATFPKWPKSGNDIERILNNFKRIYEEVDASYGQEKTPLFAGLHDIRYWIAITQRRLQEEFVEKLKPETINQDFLGQAADDFDSLEKMINDLVSKSPPPGDPDVYASKFPSNPYRARLVEQENN